MKFLPIFNEKNATIIFILLLVIILTDYVGRAQIFSVGTLSGISLLGTFFIVVIILNKRPKRFGFRLAVLLYFVLTQFAIYWCIFSLKIADSVNISNSSSSYITDLWIYSSNVTYAIEVSLIALFSMFFGFLISGSDNHEKIALNEPCNDLYAKACLFFATLAAFLLGISILSGQISLTKSYESFRESYSDKEGSSWGVCVLLLTLSISYAAAYYKSKYIKYFVVIFGAVTLVVFGTGNKGEILYPLAAAVGGYYNLNGGKINKKIFLGLLFVVFVLIPTITTFRYDGFALSNGVVTSLASPLIEMGSQARCHMFIMEEFQSGLRHDYLLGYSYISPIINIINHVLPIGTLETPEGYYGYTFETNLGFSQVAESYQNFGLFGVIIFHLILGAFLGHIDKKTIDSRHAALYISWCSMFILATRNRFSSVLPIMLIYYIVWIIIEKISPKHRI